MSGYSPPAYWSKRGKTHEAEALRDGWWAAENPELIALLDTLEFSTVLEVGCGFGRVGAFLLAHYPDITYTGFDISPDLVNGARKRLPGAEIFRADLATWDTHRTWDLVLGVSVLGHLLPKDIAGVIAKLRRWATRDIVTIDWNEVGGQTAYQYGHHYRELYGPDAVAKPDLGQHRRDPGDGRLSMWHVKP